MKVGDLVRVIQNDMSLVIKKPGPKDNKFFDQIGTIVKAVKPNYGSSFIPWFEVLFSCGYYEARKDALEKIKM